MKKKCFNCGEKADHEHHVVPKSKEGISTVPLCAGCHSKVHQSKISSGYLTMLGLFRTQKEQMCRIFFLFVSEEYTYAQIDADLKENGVHSSENWVKGAIRRMKKIDPDDLMDIFEPILQLKNSNFKRFTREWFIDTWNNGDK